VIVGVSLYAAASACVQWTGAALNPARVIASQVVFTCPDVWSVPYYLIGEFLGAALVPLAIAPWYGVSNKEGDGEDDDRVSPDQNPSTKKTLFHTVPLEKLYVCTTAPVPVPASLSPKMSYMDERTSGQSIKRNRTINCSFSGGDQSPRGFGGEQHIVKFKVEDDKRTLKKVISEKFVSYEDDDKTISEKHIINDDESIGKRTLRKTISEKHRLSNNSGGPSNKTTKPDITETEVIVRPVEIPKLERAEDRPATIELIVQDESSVKHSFSFE
jgi:hypothetical protein